MGERLGFRKYHNGGSLSRPPQAGKVSNYRFGVTNFGPLDFDSDLAPKHIRIGIIGTSETAEGVNAWLARCRGGVPAKASNHSNLFPAFPGFDQDTGFRSRLVLTDKATRTLSASDFAKLAVLKSESAVVAASVDIFIHEMERLLETAAIDVIVCAVPMQLLEAVGQFRGMVSQPVPAEAPLPLNFRHVLKARAMALRRPIQIVLPTTYDATKLRRLKSQTDREVSLQDEATRAWNIHTALYYKAGGTPWKLTGTSRDLTSCFVGVSFYRSLDGARLLTSIAHVFNERGDGVIVRGGLASISKDDSRPHVSQDDMRHLLDNALSRYRDEHHTLPARVIVHKTSEFDERELVGAREAIDGQNVEYSELISMTDSSTRLLRNGLYPTLRGTMLKLDDSRMLLYTRGSVDFFSTYPGMYVPKAMLVRCHDSDSTATNTAKEILSLTKMNWNNTQFDGAEPITIRA
ncbi:MAG: argonaute/piwi family protein, partial [Dehalococcoidia bacterium]